MELPVQTNYRMVAQMRENGKTCILWTPERSQGAACEENVRIAELLRQSVFAADAEAAAK